MPGVRREPRQRPSWSAIRTGISREESGQAAVELVAVLPLVGLSAVLCFHLALAGWSLWSAAEAARVGARAAAVETPAEARALESLPPALRERAEVDLVEGRAKVSVSPPTLLPGVALPRVSAVAGPLEPDA